MVVDTSVLLALLFDEPLAEWAQARLEEHSASLRMSTVNLTETLILLRDRQPQLYEQLEERVLSSGIRFVPPTVEHSRIAAGARLRFPLNLGDCFAYALASAEGTPVLTLDRDFQACDIPVVLPPR
jgi:ribonuclease VapC